MKKQASMMRDRSVRTSVTLAAGDYTEIQRIADRKKVSAAWVIREAVEKYLAQASPLFRDAQ